jgi:membrane-associated phospholipid phosphatase
MSRREWRYACAIFIGVIFDAVFFSKFRPYATREHGPDLLPWYFLPVFTFLAGLLLTFGIQGKKRWIPMAMFGAFCAANSFLIVADCRVDPTNHNLWPFEFVLIALATVPAFLGTGISVLIDRARIRQN